MNRSHSFPTYAVNGSAQIGPEPGWSGGPSMKSSVRATAGDRWECVRPGLTVGWNAKHATHAVREDVLCVAWGSPRCSSADSASVTSSASAEQILTQLVVAGTSALAGIRGGFGILFVDARQRRLILAVDRFSIETVCFGMDEDRLVFSDRADAVPLSQRTASTQSLYDYLYFHCIPAPATIFQQVRRMDQGGYVHVDGGRVEHGSHWKPRFAPTRRIPLTTLREQFRRLIHDVIAVEASSGAALGCFLSGGTDSSTIAGMLCAVTGSRARTYSIGFDAPGYDEMEYARIAARHFNTEHHEYYVTAEDLVRGIPEVAASCDQPFGNSSVVPAYFCTKMAGADGVSRMLAGDGGDELFGGNSRYRLQQLLDYYHWVPAWMRTRLIEPLLARRSGLNSVPVLKQAAGFVRLARTPMPDRMESFNLLSRLDRSRILNPEFLAAVDVGAPLQAQRDTYARAETGSVINRMLHYDWKYTLADADLPKVREAVRLTGMTVGYPFLADEIVDFSLRLPDDFKLRNFKLRWFFKNAMRGFLPDATLRKKKHGFGLPFGLWALKHAALYDIAGDSLAGLERRRILQAGFRDELMGRLLPAHPGYYGELVWILLMLEQWLAAHGGSVQFFPSLQADLNTGGVPCRS